MTDQMPAVEPSPVDTRHVVQDLAQRVASGRIRRVAYRRGGTRRVDVWPGGHIAVDQGVQILGDRPKHPAGSPPAVDPMRPGCVSMSNWPNTQGRPPRCWLRCDRITSTSTSVALDRRGSC